MLAALVAQHDGTVRLEETPGGGATLSIRLPHVSDDGAGDVTDDDGAASPRPGADQEHAFSNGITPPQAPSSKPVIHKGRDDR